MIGDDMLPEPTPQNDPDEVEARAAALQEKMATRRIRPAAEGAAPEQEQPPVPRRLPPPPWQVSGAAMPRDPTPRFDDFEDDPATAPPTRREEEPAELSAPQRDWRPEPEPDPYPPTWSQGAPLPPPPPGWLPPPPPGWLPPPPPPNVG